MAMIALKIAAAMRQAINGLKKMALMIQTIATAIQIPSLKVASPMLKSSRASGWRNVTVRLGFDCI